MGWGLVGGVLARVAESVGWVGGVERPARKAKKTDEPEGPVPKGNCEDCLSALGAAGD